MGRTNTLGPAQRRAERGATPLLERAAEVARLETLLTQAQRGNGRTALLQGAAGVGKTRLLDEIFVVARKRGFRVLKACGSELERDFAFGLVRQLLEQTLAMLGKRERDEVMAGAAQLAAPVLTPIDDTRGTDPPPATMDRVFSVLHGLYWLTANLAERDPLLLAVDDAHWSDSSSLRFLDYLRHRLEGLPILLVLAVRTGDPGAEDDLIRQAAADSRSEVLRPTALSEAAAATFVRALLERDADEVFCRACHHATAGNPFLLRAVVNALRVEGATGAAPDAERVKRLRPESVGRTLLIRLGRLGPAATELARAVAVLGVDAELKPAADLAALDRQGAANAADTLVAAEILAPGRPLGFVHPVVRETVYAEFAPAERALAHAHAARLLRATHAAPDRVALQLLAADPAAEAWVVQSLREASNGALARGDPCSAARYLERALAEPPATAVRAEVMRDLGMAETLAGEPGSIGHLQAALAATAPGRPRAEVARALARALFVAGRVGEAVDAFEVGIAEMGDQECDLLLALVAEAATVGRRHAETYERAAQRLKRFADRSGSEALGERMVLASLAFHRLLEGASATEATALARRALVDGLLTDQGRVAPSFYDALYVLVVADEFEDAGRLCDAAVASARATGYLLGVGSALSFRSQLAYRRGDIIAAENDARDALAAGETSRYVHGSIAMSSAFLVDALIERGELEAAATALEGIRGGAEVPHSVMPNFLLYSRGRLRIAAGDLAPGVADLLELGQREERQRGRNPGAFPYRAVAAAALAQLGKVAEARKLAKEQLALARRWGARRAIGIALRARGLVEGGERGIGLLEEAVATLAGSGAKLEHAHALVDLGSALRRIGRRAEARRRLGEGMDLAHRCGARALVTAARGELRVAGARPRRVRLSGVEALTASERRITGFAANGMANKDIAQTLFVTLRTVEMHLSSAYGKLGIRSRKELSQALARDS